MLVKETAVVLAPTSKGKNIHVIGAITSYSVVLMTHRRGAFKSENAIQWVNEMLARLPDNVLPEHVVLVCDNAPCHSRLEQCIEANPGLTVLRLAPYSPMLNPIEQIWSKIKSHVKRNMSVPNVSGDNLGEQRLQYVECRIQNAIGSITTQDCARCCQHSQTFFGAAMVMEDMNVGQ